jgi:hypothetical protein
MKELTTVVDEGTLHPKENQSGLGKEKLSNTRDYHEPLIDSAELREGDRERGIR